MTGWDFDGVRNLGGVGPWHGVTLVGWFDLGGIVSPWWGGTEYHSSDTQCVGLVLGLGQLLYFSSLCQTFRPTSLRCFPPVHHLSETN